ncbi:unnamed protein product [Alternaria burnsii]|nr:unnamed protein product [Alternaria burnsii]
MANFAGMVTQGSLTPSIDHETYNNGTMVSSYAADGFQHPPFTALGNYAQKDLFPIFETGDVFIETKLVTPPKQWRLHSEVLARFSSWFARALSGMAATVVGATRAAYTIEEVDGEILLIQKEATKEWSFIRDNKSDVLSDMAIKIENEDSDSKAAPGITPEHATIIDMYNQVFSAFYNFAINMPTVNIAASINHFEQLTKIAGGLGCLENLPNLTSQMNATLFQHRHSLFRAIKNDPARWLLLSLSLKNESIYKESLIHMCGAHPCWPWPTPRSSLPKGIRHLITTKSFQLHQRCAEVERELLLLTIHVGRGTNNHAVSPLTNSEFDTWFIVSTFRSILGQELISLDNNRKKPLLRGNMFRKIKKGEGYMPYEDMRRMMEQVMPSAVQNLSEDLAMLKREASIYVEDLARNECLLDVEAQKVGWLTCVKIEKEDIPWGSGG